MSCKGCKSTPEDTSKNFLLMLLKFFPFLTGKFRELKESETKSEEVFKELFPNNKDVDFGYLMAIYQYQQKSKKQSK